MSVLLNFRIDEELKKDMDVVCKSLGITMSAAFNMFAKDLVKNKKISFTASKKLDSGISLEGLYDRLGGGKSTKNDINDYFVNKVGNIIMLIPKDDVWANLIESSGKMSDDFMVDRIQNVIDEREVI